MKNDHWKMENEKRLHLRIFPYVLISNLFLKDLMPPQPLVAPSFDEAEFTQTRKSRREIEHDVLRMVLIDFGVEASEQITAGL